MTKLVRDKIPEIIGKKQPGVFKFRKPKDDEEYKILLMKKLREETEEVVRDMAFPGPECHVMEEIADVLETVNAIMKFYKLSQYQITRKMSDKVEEKGKFDQKWIMESIKKGIPHHEC